jgi:hypothetical protein
MQFELRHALEVLERTPATLQSLVGGLTRTWTHASGEPGSWTPHEVVGHLIHGEETDWIPRARIILEHGQFDRFAQLERFKDEPTEALLDRFARLRRRNLDELKELRISAEQWDLCGTHPALGTVTLRHLIATWVVHDLGHIAQITRVMSKHYTDEVGPWKAYLPVLNR